jgi:hypothetical protein
MAWHIGTTSTWHQLAVLLAQVWGRRSSSCVTENSASYATDKSGLDPIPASPAVEMTLNITQIHDGILHYARHI